MTSRDAIQDRIVNVLKQEYKLDTPDAIVDGKFDNAFSARVEEMISMETTGVDKDIDFKFNGLVEGLKMLKFYELMVNMVAEWRAGITRAPKRTAVPRAKKANVFCPTNKSWTMPASGINHF